MTPEDEVEQLKREIDEAARFYAEANKRSNKIAVVGPAGSGKTSLWLELTHQTDVPNIDELVGVRTDMTTEEEGVTTAEKLDFSQFPGYGTSLFSAKDYFKQM